ncbi:MAG: 2-C-methyl-D-erythritol 4-phosphate cytidylyltransferase [Bacteroidales bacterium]|nr:2-C-methyl-D-erythritol 4-phosphate cytidylyltransferase [Bacteroidales bacterium]
MNSDRKKYVVIMAAGSGTRMGADKPKQFLELDGKMILRRTVETFLSACPGIAVVVVLPEEYIPFWKDYCYRENFVCPQVLVKGGITRFHSVRNALEKVPEGALVAIHDGVRPLVTENLIQNLFSKAARTGSAIPVTPCVDTMKVLERKVWEDGSETFASIPGQKVDRSLLYGAQTPQVFYSELLKSAYGQPFDTGFTDDASVVEKYGKSLSYVLGERLNIKITTKEDLLLAEAVLKNL